MARSIGLLVILALTTAACSTAPTPLDVDEPSLETVQSVPGGTSIARPSAGSVPPDSPSPTTSTLQLGPDDVAQVVTTDLVVRSAPGVSADSEIYPEMLNEPTLLFVVDGPVPADGFDWYLVQPFTRNVCVDVCPLTLPFGWVAQAGSDGESWIAPTTLECPEPDAGDIGWLSPTARLACYGNDTLVLEGIFGGCYAAETPIALLQTGCEIRPTDYVERDTFQSFLIMYSDGAAGMTSARQGRQIDVTGHFDDASSSSCGWSEDFNDEAGNAAAEPPPPELVILRCRTAFVVTDMTVAEQ